MNAVSDVDKMLIEVGNRVFNSGPVRKRVRRGMTGLRSPQSQAGPIESVNRSLDAKAVRHKIQSIVKRTPQVIVRISGAGKGMRHIKAHLDYISRNGQIPLEDQNGDKLEGKDEIDALRDEWQLGGFPIVDKSNHREAFNLVLSMPAGTSEIAVLGAARNFAADEFSNFQYAMALHTFDTDPNGHPSPNPHVHLCVKATALDGLRLNPRKADLQRWREQFAERLREHGVACEATRRLHRLQPHRGEKQSVRHKKLRGETLEQFGHRAANHERTERARRLKSEMLAGYHQLASALAMSADPDDRQLALGIVHRLSESKSDREIEGRRLDAPRVVEKGKEDR